MLHKTSIRHSPERKGQIVNILGDNFFEQICLILCIYIQVYVRGIYGSNIRLKYSGIMGFLTNIFADVHDENEINTNKYGCLIFPKL